MGTIRITVTLATTAGLLLLLPLSGCPCECYDPCDATEQAFATAEQTPLGYSADDLVADIAAQHDTTMTYEDGSSTAVATIALVQLIGDARFVDQEPREGTSPEECTDFVDVDAEVTFATDDGAFDEVLTGRVHHGEGHADQTLWFSMPEEDLAYGQLHGSYQVTEVDPADCETLEFGWGIDFLADGSTGSVGYHCIREVGTTDDGDTIMSSSSYGVGSW